MLINDFTNDDVTLYFYVTFVLCLHIWRRFFKVALYDNNYIDVGIFLKIKDTLKMYQLIEEEWRIYVPVNYAIIGSDDGFLPGGRQTIIWPKAVILLTERLGINFTEIPMKIHIFSLHRRYSRKLGVVFLRLRKWSKYIQNAPSHQVVKIWTTDRGMCVRIFM